MKARRVEPNLYIQTNASGEESWIARFYEHGKSTWRGLGNVKYVTKKQARETAQALRLAIRTKEIPLQVRRVPTFAEILTPALNDIQNSRQWKHGVMRHRWEQTLTSIAVPIIGKKHVDEIEPDDILRCLKPTWTTKHVVTSRTRARIEAVLNWCILKKYCKTNPAVWKGNLEFALPRSAKVHTVKHMEAPTIDEVKAVVAYCRKHPSVVSGILLLLVATVGRVRECSEITRKEIDGDVWTAPAERMKADREHRVPLTKLAMEGLAMGSKRGEIIFPGSAKAFVSADSPRLKLREIVGRAVTAHGLRSSFKDWAAREGVEEILSEKALSHKFGDKTVQAYQRDDLLERRRKVMEKWAKAVG